MVEKSFCSGKPSVAVSISGLEKCFFYCGKGMQKKWVESKTIFEKQAWTERKGVIDGR